MVRSSRALIAGVLSLFVAGAAAAEPIAVEYFVVRKDFKKVATSTDVLLFELFSDSSCTTLIDSENLFASDTVLQYYVDKTQAREGRRAAAEGRPHPRRSRRAAHHAPPRICA